MPVFLTFISFYFPFLCRPFRVLFSHISFFFLFYILSSCICLVFAPFLPLYCGVSHLILFSVHSFLITPLVFPFCVYFLYRFPLLLLLYVTPFVCNSKPYIPFTFISFPHLYFFLLSLLHSFVLRLPSFCSFSSFSLCSPIRT